MRTITIRKKSGPYFCTVYASRLGGTIWTIGLVINKSKRASNDWYKNRKNKRRQRVKNDCKLKTLKEIRVGYNLVKIMIQSLPHNADILIYNDFKKAEALSKYVERLGFTPVYRDGFPVWVLIAPKREEVLPRF